MIVPHLTTSRLQLRPVADTDHEMVFKGFSHPDVIKYFDINFKTLEATVEQMEWYKTNVQNNTGCYWVVYNEQHAFMGVFSIYHIHAEYRKAEIGYWLFPEFWNLGYASEALKAMLDFAKQTLNLHRIAAEIEPENVGSWKMLQKIGFELEGTFRDYEFKNGKFNDLQVWAKLL